MDVFCVLYSPNNDETRLLAAFSDEGEAKALMAKVHEDLGSTARVKRLELDADIGSTFEPAWEAWGFAGESHVSCRFAGLACRRGGETHRVEVDDDDPDFKVAISFVSASHAQEIVEGLCRDEAAHGSVLAHDEPAS